MNDSGLSMRLAEEEDCELLWGWKNEEQTRKYAFDSRTISYHEHQNWYHKTLKSANTKICIISDQDQRIGQVRFDIDKIRQGEIDISIDAQKRKKGYGAKALEMACRYSFEHFGITGCIAHIKKDNIASIKTFRNAGFEENGLMVFKGHQAVEMVLERNKN